MRGPEPWVLRWVLPALLVSQMLAPLWGHWHRIAHSVFAQGVLLASASETSVHGHQSPSADSAVQSHRAGDALCQLLDQLSLLSGPMACVQVVQVFALPCADLPGFLTSVFWLHAWPLYQARAPPFS